MRHILVRARRSSALPTSMLSSSRVNSSPTRRAETGCAEHRHAGTVARSRIHCLADTLATLTFGITARQYWSAACLCWLDSKMPLCSGEAMNWFFCGAGGGHLAELSGGDLMTIVFR